MDYFGEILDEITELYEKIESSPNAVDGRLVLKALERAMKMAVWAERERTKYDPPTVRIDLRSIPNLIAPDFTQPASNTVRLGGRYAAPIEEARSASD